MKGYKTQINTTRNGNKYLDITLPEDTNIETIWVNHPDGMVSVTTFRDTKKINISFFGLREYKLIVSSQRGRKVHSDKW